MICHAMMLDIANPWVRWSYFGIAVLGSLFYGAYACRIFKVTPDNWPSKAHQFLFNATGAAIGWLAGWVLIVRWLGCPGFVCKDEPSLWLIVVAAVAFVGITGHLPLTLQSLREWSQKHKEEKP